MSFFLYVQRCGDCGATWQCSFGIVGTSQIGTGSVKKCPKCGSENPTKEIGMPTDLALGKLQAENASLRSRIAELERDESIMRDAYANVREFVRDFSVLDDDAANACQRATMRRLEEAMGERLTRLLMEKGDQKLYGEHYRELATRAERAETELSKVREALQKFNRERGYHDGPHDGLGGMACSECVASYNRAEEELDAALTSGEKAGAALGIESKERKDGVDVSR